MSWKPVDEWIQAQEQAAEEGLPEGALRRISEALVSNIYRR